LEQATQLVPTKAVLYGLDVRFRAVDKKIEEDKSKSLSSLIFYRAQKCFQNENIKDLRIGKLHKNDA